MTFQTGFILFGLGFCLGVLVGVFIVCMGEDDRCPNETERQRRFNEAMGKVYGTGGDGA